LLATQQWLSDLGSSFRPVASSAGLVQLQHYTATYQVWGEGQPLVIVPGLAGGLELLGPLARLLSPHFQVISYQLRGEDDCFVMRRGFGLKDLVDDLDEMIEWLGLERTALMGVSFGGLLALEYAARKPGRLSSLIVQGVGSRFESGLLHQLAGAILSQYPLPPDNPFVNQFFNLLFGKRQGPGPLFEFVTRQCWQTDQSVMTHRFRLAETFDISDRMQRITAPSLILAGERDLLVSPKGLDELAAGIEGAKQVRFKDEGHLAFVTCPQRIAREVRGFLSDL
jgi:pimeloyl-ACP methyl ester carboxylesterase